jgi:hypothetical protein
VLQLALAVLIWGEPANGNFSEKHMISAIEAPTTQDLALIRSENLYKAAGIALVSIVPAMFWTALLVAAGHAFGVPFESSSLVTVFAAIALFLAAVCAPVMTRV